MAGWIPQIDFDIIMHIEATGRPKPESPWAFPSPMVSLTHSLHTQRKKACRAAPPQPPRSHAARAGPLIIIHMKAESRRQPVAAAARPGNRGNTSTDRHHAHALQSESAGRSLAGARSFGRPVASFPLRSLPPRREERRRHNLRSLERAVNPMHAGTPRRTRERERNKNR